MSIGILRAKGGLSIPITLTSQGNMPILVTLQTQDNEKTYQNEPKNIESTFIPFINERDKMNRLVTGEKNFTPKKQRVQFIYENINDKWIQNDPMKLKIPPKRLSLEERHTIKQRSRSNADYRHKILLANTERQSFLLSQDQSTNPQFEDYKKAAYQNILNKKKQLLTTSPCEKQSITKNSSCENLQKCSIFEKMKQSRSPSITRCQNQPSIHKQKHFLNFKLPTLIQKEYVKQFLESNKKIKDLLSDQNNEKFKFPLDFEPKILEMKKQLKKMKSRLKNWESDREVTDNKMFLKEIASGILNK